MLRQIFSQIWYYRRNQAWFLVELVLIFLGMWFLTDWLATAYYARSLPAGYDAADVYVVKTDPAPEPSPLSLRQMADRLRMLDEVEAAAVFACAPGGASFLGSTLLQDSTDAVQYMLMQRLLGTEDAAVLRYDWVWPEDGRVEEVPGGIILTEDLARSRFPGVPYPEIRDFSAPVVGVVRPMQVEAGGDLLPVCIRTVVPDEADATMEVLLRLRAGADPGPVDELVRRWRRDNPFDGVKVNKLVPMQERLDEEYRLSGNRRETVFSLLLAFLLMNVLISVASYNGLRLRDRRTEIGLRRALGAGRGAVLRQWLTESWLLGAAAVFLGGILLANILLFGSVSLCQPDLRMVTAAVQEDYPFLYHIPVHVTVVTLLTAGMMWLAVTLGALIPVWKGLRLSPVESLRENG